jgi:hypothetical protein
MAHQAKEKIKDAFSVGGTDLSATPALVIWPGRGVPGPIVVVGHEDGDTTDMAPAVTSDTLADQAIRRPGDVEAGVTPIQCRAFYGSAQALLQ